MPPQSSEANDQRIEFEGIQEALLRLARGEKKDLAPLLHDIEVQTLLDGSRVTFHCHCLRLDGNGRARIADLVAAVCDFTLDFAIPRSVVNEAKQEMLRTGSTRRLVHLETEARALFTHLVNSGEGGELLLFALAETVLRLPQLLCKMDLKTNSNVHVHGADGLHAGVDPQSGHLLLYWGESKLHADATDAIRECFKSLAPMLNSSGETGAGARDLHLLGRHADLSEPELERALKEFLDPQHERFNQLEFCGLCMIGFDSASYPTAANAASFSATVDAIRVEITTWKKSILKRLGAESLAGFAIHAICVPFPSVDDFRHRLLGHLGLL